MNREPVHTQAATPTIDDVLLPNPTPTLQGPAASHFISAGEHRFNRITYNGIGYVANALLSIGAVFAAERTHAGRAVIENIGNFVSTRFNLSGKRSSFVATKTAFLVGGFAVLPPMKWMESHKSALVKKWNHQIYGDKADTDPALLQSQHELETGPKQSWSSIAASRALALLPFYITTTLLWDNKSVLARKTNSAFKGFSKQALETMEDVNAIGFSQKASKGIYFDRPIVWASRWLGKIATKVIGNKEAEQTIKEMERDFPGIMKQGVVGSKDRDTAHSSVPYYFISEAITSAMVAWGVYVLTRVLGPLFDSDYKAEKRLENYEANHTVADEASHVPKQTPQMRPQTKIQAADLQHHQAQGTTAAVAR